MANTATTLAEAAIQAPSGKSLSRAVDRWIYVFMAASFIVYTLIGFIPDSLAKIAAVDAGQRAPFPLVLHAHAILMGAFLILLLTQSLLAASGRLQYHRTLGIAAFVLGPALVIVGLVLVPTMYHQVWDPAQSAPPEIRSMIEQGLRESLQFAVRGGIHSAVTADGRTAWMATHVDLKGRLTMPYRFFYIWLREQDTWEIVVSHDAVIIDPFNPGFEAP